MDISSKKQHLPSIFVLVLPLEREVQQSLEIVDVVGPVVLQEVNLLCLLPNGLRVVAHEGNLRGNDDHLQVGIIEELIWITAFVS